MTAVTAEPREDGDRIAFRFPFDADVVDHVRRLPWRTRTFDREEREWLVDEAWADALIAELTSAGHQIVDHRAPAALSSGWADALLEAVGPELEAGVFRALSRVLHPDHGGRGELAAELNAARDRRRSR